MRILILLLLLLPQVGLTQKIENLSPLPIIANKVHYSEVVESGQPYNIQQLHKNATPWNLKEQTHFNNQVENKEEWKLKNAILYNSPNELFGICRIAIKVNPITNYYSLNFHLLFKNGKYKYEFSNFRSLGNTMREPLTKNFNHTDNAIEKVLPSKNQVSFIKSEMDGLIRDFKEDILRKSDFIF